MLIVHLIVVVGDVIPHSSSENMRSSCSSQDTPVGLSGGIFERHPALTHSWLLNVAPTDSTNASSATTKSLWSMCSAINCWASNIADQDVAFKVPQS